MATHDIPALLAFADALADAARRAILPYFRAEHDVADKGGRDGFLDPVTEADKASERAMREMVERDHPEHGFLGEEFEETLSRSGYQWIVDPIDGTRAFIAGLPTWGVLIALAYEGAPLIGIMDQPYLDERYRGWNNGADVLTRGRRKSLRTRVCPSLSDAICATTDPFLFEGAEIDCFARLRRRAKLTRYGYDCYAYAMIAAGHIDCVAESGLRTFDIAALIPIISGAGGGVCSWDGCDATHGGRVLAWGDARVRDEALTLLA